jgi:hypothetical protein
MLHLHFPNLARICWLHQNWFSIVTQKKYLLQVNVWLENPGEKSTLWGPTLRWEGNIKRSSQIWCENMKLVRNVVQWRILWIRFHKNGISPADKTVNLSRNSVLWSCFIASLYYCVGVRLCVCGTAAGSETVVQSPADTRIKRVSGGMLLTKESLSTTNRTGMLRARTRTPTVRSRRLTACIMSHDLLRSLKASVCYVKDF